MDIPLARQVNSKVWERWLVAYTNLTHAWAKRKDVPYCPTYPSKYNIVTIRLQRLDLSVTPNILQDITATRTILITVNSR